MNIKLFGVKYKSKKFASLPFSHSPMY